MSCAGVLAVAFLHPGLAGAALAAGLVPILIHLINRRRYRRVSWAAMSFLLAASKRSIRRVRLEQWLLLLARVAPVVLLGLALARPYVPASGLVSLGVSRSHRVVVIDNSMSMNARYDAAPGSAGDRTRFSVAMATAKRLVASFPMKDAVSIVTLAAPAHAVLAQAGYDRRFVEEQLAKIAPTHRAADVAGGLAHALRIVRSSDVPPQNRAVYVVSDLAGSTWRAGASAVAPGPTQAARRLAALADAAAVTVVRTAGSAEVNAAVTSVATESPVVGVNLPMRIAATVTNFGPRTLRGAALQVALDGRIIHRLSLPAVEPGASQVMSATTLCATPDTHAISAKVVGVPGDALPEDDARHLSITVRRTVPVLLVDGRIGPTPLSGQAGYLATALAPRPSATDVSLIEPKIVTELELDGEALDRYDVVALCNVRRLSQGQWKDIAAHVARGGGLMVFGGDLVSVDNYNRFGHADGRGVLPGRLGRPAAAGDEADAGAGIVLGDERHPIVAELAAEPNSGLFTARVDKHLTLEVTREDVDTLLRYTDAEPAIVLATFGEGRVALCTTTADMAWTNLPAKGDYVSLMSNIVSFIAPALGGHRNVTVGQMVVEPLRPAQASMSLRVTAGDGRADDGRLVPDGEDGLALAFGPVEDPGVVTCAVGPDRIVFAVNVDPAESDIGGATGDDLEGIAGADATIIDDPSELERRHYAPRASELALLAMYAAVALLFGEMWLAMRLGLRGG